MIISTNAKKKKKKAFDKIQHPFMIKTLSKLEQNGNPSTAIQAICENPQLTQDI